MKWKDQSRIQSKSSESTSGIFEQIQESITWSEYYPPIYLRLPVQASKTSANHSPVPLKEPVKKSGGCLWKLMRLLLILAVIAAVSYYVYCRVVNNDDNPFGIQWSDISITYQAPLVHQCYQWSCRSKTETDNSQNNKKNKTIMVFMLGPFSLHVIDPFWYLRKNAFWAHS